MTLAIDWLQRGYIARTDPGIIIFLKSSQLAFIRVPTARMAISMRSFIMLKSALIGAGLLWSSLSIATPLTSFSGYNLDTSTNIVTGGGLEWLQWDETVGQSVEEALTTYTSDGWRLSTRTEVTALFNAFDFGLIFDPDYTDLQHVGRNPTVGELDSHNYFISIFGDTFAASGSVYDFGDPHQVASAYFGDDFGDGVFNTALVIDDYTHPSLSEENAYARLSGSKDLIGPKAPTYGVSLVRSIPEPPFLGLLFTGLAVVLSLKALSSSKDAVGNKSLI